MREKWLPLPPAFQFFRYKTIETHALAFLSHIILASAGLRHILSVFSGNFKGFNTNLFLSYCAWGEEALAVTIEYWQNETCVFTMHMLQSPGNTVEGGCFPLKIWAWPLHRISTVEIQNLNSVLCHFLLQVNSLFSILLVQVNRFQRLLFLHHLTHNMTADCLLNYEFGA